MGQDDFSRTHSINICCTARSSTAQPYRSLNNFIRLGLGAVLPASSALHLLCQKNPAPTLTVSARMVVLKKKANTQCSVVILRMFLDVTLTSAVAVAVPMMNE